jgi:hypothetical protein
MTPSDPMKLTKEERMHALHVILWALTIVKNTTSDQAKRNRVDRAQRALNGLGDDLTSETWPPAGP